MLGENTPPTHSRNLENFQLTPDSPTIKIRVDDMEPEPWLLTHVLTPLHSKVRLSFAQIQDIGHGMASRMFAALQTRFGKASPIGIGIRILRAHKYVEKLLASKPSPSRSHAFFDSVSLSRYVGLIKLISREVGEYDVLIDTTGTSRNQRCLGIVLRGDETDEKLMLGATMAHLYDCDFIY